MISKYATKYVTILDWRFLWWKDFLKLWWNSWKRFKIDGNKRKTIERRQPAMNILKATQLIYQNENLCEYIFQLFSSIPLFMGFSIDADITTYSFSSLFLMPHFALLTFFYFFFIADPDNMFSTFISVLIVLFSSRWWKRKNEQDEEKLFVNVIPKRNFFHWSKLIHLFGKYLDIVEICDWAILGKLFMWYGYLIR